MLIIGHRGAMGYEPENTLRSFRKAIELGVDMIELDVYLLNDRSLVVIHDDTVDRTTNGKGYVLDQTFEEIRQLDAGRGEKIPTLQEVLDLADRKISVNIELKGEHTAGPVARVIQEYVTNNGWQFEKFSVSSFNHHELQAFKKLLPQVKIGALIVGIPVTYAKFAEELGAYSVNVSLEFINQAFVNDAHERGLKIFVFTVNERDDSERMKRLGVDGIFSNYPDKVR